MNTVALNNNTATPTHTSYRKMRLLRPAVLASILAVAATQPVQALTITPSFDGSITGLANAADIESTLNTAASTIAGIYTDPITVNILFKGTHAGSNGFLGHSNTGYYFNSYGYYTDLLKADAALHPENAALNTAVLHLAEGNDADGSREIFATSANLRALGDATATPCFNSSGNFVSSSCGQMFDGVIEFNLDLPIDYTRPIPAYNGSNEQYDGLRIAEHEVNEILGGGGTGSVLNDIFIFGLNNPADDFSFRDGVLDLYRYSAANTPSFSISDSVTAYFSVDGGTTNIADFNQHHQGDFGDLGDLQPCPGGGRGGNHVQSAFTCNNEQADFTRTSPEFTMLESIGYDPVSVPEPASAALLGSGLLALFYLQLTRRARTTPPQEI